MDSYLYFYIRTCLFDYGTMFLLLIHDQTFNDR
uniref:Uncharacterized protein n=1 Tax=Rhizophora mucronata TaxID=61149 RepID=A0A2P2Q8R7_RHIMU